MDNNFTLFLCLPTLELTTFEQQLYPIKSGHAYPLSMGTNNSKDRNVTTLNNTHQAKKVV